jgi:hypothetical protein
MLNHYEIIQQVAAKASQFLAEKNDFLAADILCALPSDGTERTATYLCAFWNYPGVKEKWIQLLLDEVITQYIQDECYLDRQNHQVPVAGSDWF